MYYGSISIKIGSSLNANLQINSHRSKVLWRHFILIHRLLSKDTLGFVALWSFAPPSTIGCLLEGKILSRVLRFIQVSFHSATGTSYWTLLFDLPPDQPRIRIEIGYFIGHSQPVLLASYCQNPHLLYMPIKKCLILSLSHGSRSLHTMRSKNIR